MSDERPPLRTARVIHQCSARTRFRVDGANDDTIYFRSVVKALEEHAAVQKVVCNPLTSTVLVHHTPALRSTDLLDLAEEKGCFALGEPEDRGTPIEELRKLFRRMEGDAVRLSEGRMDVESVALALLLMAAVTGIVRGQIVPPAATAVWYALQLIWKRGPEDTA